MGLLPWSQKLYSLPTACFSSLSLSSSPSSPISLSHDWAQDKMMASVKKSRVKGDQEESLTEEDMAAKNRGLDSDLSLSRSLITEELYMSQLQLDHLPIEMGDTLFLQLSHVKKLACMRNNFTGLLSPKVPQVTSHRPSSSAHRPLVDVCVPSPKS